MMASPTRDFAMIMWIVSTVLASIVAVLVSAPFIWRYAVRHSAAAFEARARAYQITPAENGRLARPDRRPPSESDAAFTDDPNSRRGGHIYRNSCDLGRGRLSGLVVLGFVGIYALTLDSPPSADPSSVNRSLVPPVSQAAGPFRNLQLFSKSPSSADRLLDQLRAICAGRHSRPRSTKGQFRTSARR